MSGGPNRRAQGRAPERPGISLCRSEAACHGRIAGKRQQIRAGPNIQAIVRNERGQQGIGAGPTIHLRGPELRVNGLPARGPDPACRATPSIPTPPGMLRRGGQYARFAGGVWTTARIGQEPASAPLAGGQQRAAIFAPGRCGRKDGAQPTSLAVAAGRAGLMHLQPAAGAVVGAGAQRLTARTGETQITHRTPPSS